MRTAPHPISLASVYSSNKSSSLGNLNLGKLSTFVFNDLIVLVCSSDHSNLLCFLINS